MHIEHDHNHGHDKSHTHGHSHEQTPGHSHEQDHAKSPEAPAKDLALLKYMIEHNKQHARELSETGERLAEAGYEHASDMINDAVHYFDHANDSLEIAAKLIKGE